MLMIDPDRFDARIRELLSESSAPLGDVGRARVGAKLMASINAPGPARPFRASRLRTVSIVAIGAAACIGLGWWVGASRTDVSLELAAQPIETPAVDVTSLVPARPVPLPPRVIRVAVGERKTISVGRAELTLFGPGAIEISTDSEQSPTVVVESGTLIGSLDHEPITVVDKARTQTLSGGTVAVRVERGTIVASAATEQAVRRVFRAELVAHLDARLDAHNEARGIAQPNPVVVAPPTPSTALPEVASLNDAGVSSDPAISELDPPIEPSLYADAEAAMKRGKLRKAQGLLRKLVADEPDSSDAAFASYDLALLAHRLGQHREALARLDAILANPAQRTRHLAAKRLRCRIVASKQGRDASGC